MVINKQELCTQNLQGTSFLEFMLIATSDNVGRSVELTTSFRF